MYGRTLYSGLELVRALPIIANLDVADGVERHGLTPSDGTQRSQSQFVYLVVGYKFS